MDSDVGHSVSCTCLCCLISFSYISGLQSTRSSAKCHRIYQLEVQTRCTQKRKISRYGKNEDNRWHQDYNNLIANGYPEHLKDKKEEGFKMPFQVNIDHLRQRPGSHPPPGRLPDVTQPPPTTHPISPGVLPSKFTRPPPLPGMLPLDYHSRPAADGHLSQQSNQHYQDDPQGYKRHLPRDYRSEEEPPYKTSHQAGNSGYRREYDDIYTSSPGPSAPPSHRAQYWDREYQDLYRRDDPRPHASALGDSPELSRFNDAKRYSLRDEDNYSPIPRELGEGDSLCVHVPEWLVQDGGELCLSETDRGVALIRYWPNFMTPSGQMSIFRNLRKALKWHQRRALVEGKWQNLPHLLSWIGPCDYSYSGVTLEKNTSWPPEIVDLLHRLIRYTGNQYNSCFLQLYRNGYDNTAWTAETHAALRDNPSIAMVSLGVTRVFEMQRKDGGGFVRFPMFPGSLLLMEGATQEDWHHQFPKQPNVAAERINVTFRKMFMIEGLTV